MLDNIITIITGPTVEKTIDPLYVKAKRKLKKIVAEVEQVDDLIYRIELIEKMLQLLSEISNNFGKTISESFSDAPEDKQLKAQTNLNFTKNFYALTNCFLIPRLNKYVIEVLNQIKDKAYRLVELKENIKLLRQEYDLSRAIVNDLYTNHSNEEEILKNAITKMNKDNQLYTKYNTKFINSVNKLKQKRKSTFDIPIKNMLCLTSQYLMQIFTEIQKYRISYPPEIFTPKKSE